MDVWYLLLDETAEYSQLSSYAELLPRDRQQKIERLRFDDDKLLSLSAGLLLRHLLPRDSVMRYNDYGKPYLESLERFFSLSHSGRAIAMAIDTDELGVDIERRRDQDIDKLAGRFFSPGEQAYTRAAEDKSAAFTRIWTRKEAYIKREGTGLSTDLLSFDTTLPPLCDQIYTTVIGGYTLSVCSTHPIETVHISQIELKELL